MNSIFLPSKVLYMQLQDISHHVVEHIETSCFLNISFGGAIDHIRLWALIIMRFVGVDQADHVLMLAFPQHVDLPLQRGHKIILNGVGVLVSGVLLVEG